MVVNLWFSKELEIWRWTLTSSEDSYLQESGSQRDLRDAMDDIANTIEYLLNIEEDPSV
jgi:hypothetical protein